MAIARHVLRLPKGVRERGPLLRRLAERVRSRHLFALDLIGLSLAAYVALAGWLEVLPDTGTIAAYLWIGGIIVATRVAVDILLGIYTHTWRYASVGDMATILVCVVAGSAAAAGIVFGVMALGPEVAAGPPGLAFWLLEATLALGVLATPRFLIRGAFSLSSRPNDASGEERTLLYGAGWAGVMIARSAERSPDTNVVPVGFLDDNPDLRGRQVIGLPVFGNISDLGRARRRTGATSLLITMPRAQGAKVRDVVEAAMAQGLDVRTVPAVTDLIDGSIDATRIRKVRVEDLLRRPPARDHAPALRELLKGRTVMVTGAAGSIGSELVRQVIALEPAHVVMVDQAESAIYMCALELASRSQVEKGATTISTHLIDITDRAAVLRLMQETKPVVVFHAAAYKHVPMLEQHVVQAVRANIAGTLSVVDAAAATGVERFVLVSTDKAVEPSSIMGATKRIAEMIVADVARRTGRAYVAVRFGNVLGSNGSVIPVFQAQLESGQPLTITHPEMTRYFMTIPEAAWLILDAAALSESGSLYVLDMGDPVRIIDIARDLVRLSGQDPDSVPMRVVGLRPGEKLHEELFYADEPVAPTNVPKVLRTASPALPDTIREDVERLLGLAKADDDQALRTALFAYVRRAETTPQPIAFQWEGTEAEAGVPSGPVVAVPVHTDGNGADMRSGPGSAGDRLRAGNGSEPADAEDELLRKRIVISSTGQARPSRGEDPARVGHPEADAGQAG